METQSVGEIIRKAESDYTHGTTHQSQYVDFQMHDTIDRIEAYLNSKHISGEHDSLGREKPFYNISIAAANIWFRATDIDRKDIKIRASAKSGWLTSFAATVKLREWMRVARFGMYLNDWGRTLARYCSAVTKFVENDEGLHISVVPWNRLICDPLDFDNNPKIEVLDLTMAQLKERVETHGYDEGQVDALCTALTTRRTLEKQTKDRKSDYIRIYELHGKLQKALLKTENEEVTPADLKKYVQQMHVVSFVGTKTGRKMEYEDFTLVCGEEKNDPYRIAHLMKEDGRTLGIGAVESLFQAQWMTNHSKKAVKDTLDVASILLLQTADASFVGRNILTDMTNGDIFVHGVNTPLTQVNNSKPDTTQWENYAVSWKQLGNEIAGVSDAMLGVQPKSGTAWRQTEALLNESYSLFEVMTENKALYLEDMMREFILPYLQTQLDTSEEVGELLEAHEIDKIDSVYIKSRAAKEAKRKAIVEPLLRGDLPTKEGYDESYATSEEQIKESLSALGNQRFFKPSEIESKTWKEQFKDLPWDVEIDITGESENVQEALTTLNTALKLVLTPGFDQNPKAQAIVGRVLELSGTMSPVEYNAIPAVQPAPQIPQPAPATEPLPQDQVATP